MRRGALAIVACPGSALISTPDSGVFDVADECFGLLGGRVMQTGVRDVADVASRHPSGRAIDTVAIGTAAQRAADALSTSVSTSPQKTCVYSVPRTPPRRVTGTSASWTCLRTHVFLARARDNGTWVTGLQAGVLLGRQCVTDG